MKSKTIQLIHPHLGVCAQEISSEVERVKNMWKYRYGKKYLECKVVVDPDKPKYKERKVVNIATGDVYDTPEEASKEMGMSIVTIRKHLNKGLSPKSHYSYKVKWG